MKYPEAVRAPDACSLSVIIVFTCCTALLYSSCGENGKAPNGNLRVRKEPLPVTYHAQEMTNWCWAAVSQMIMEAVAQELHPQCCQVNCTNACSVRKGTCCAASIACGNSNDSCNSAGLMPDCNLAGDVNQPFETYGFCMKEQRVEDGPALSWNAIKAALLASPIAIKWDTDDGPHYTLAIDFLEAGQSDTILVDDPNSYNGTPLTMTYEQYAGTQDYMYKLHRTLYNIEKQQIRPQGSPACLKY